MAFSPRVVNIDFPLGGFNRRLNYTDQTRPYSTFRCMNVRGVGSLEKRVRGGSRPGTLKYINNDFGNGITGISKITYVDGNDDINTKLIVINGTAFNIVDSSSVTETTANFVTDNGDNIITDDGDQIIFESTVASGFTAAWLNSYNIVEYRGKIFIADSTPKVYDPNTGVVSTVANAPSNQPLITFYRERMVLSGNNHMFYMSRQMDTEDWNTGFNDDDSARAVYGFAGDRGKIGNPIRFMMPWNDEALILGTKNDMWAVYGNLAGNGELKNISHHVGCIAPKAGTITPDGLVVFLSKDGIYTWQIGSNSDPKPYSQEKSPEDLRDIDISSNEILMEYDHNSKGVYLFVTPGSGVGTNWWISLKNKAVWPFKLPEGQQPLSTTKLPQDGYSDVLLGCKDGYLRQFSDSATDDDGVNISSMVALGPVHWGRSYNFAGQIQKLSGDFANNSEEIDFKIITGNTAEEAADNTDAAYNANWGNGVDYSGSWTANHNGYSYPRSRGGWGVIVLTSIGRWSFEKVTAYIRQLGMIK